MEHSSEKAHGPQDGWPRREVSGGHRNRDLAIDKMTHFMPGTMLWTSPPSWLPGLRGRIPGFRL